MNRSQARAGAEPTASFMTLTGWGRRASRLRGFLLVAVTVTVFYLLFRRIDLRQTLLALGRMSGGVWILAALLTVSFPVMSATRWHLILRSSGHAVPLRRCLLIILGIWPLTAISPSKIGDLLKAVSLRRDLDMALVVGSVLTERVLDVLVLAVFALVGGVALGESSIVAIAALVVSAVCILLVLSRFHAALPIGEQLQTKLRTVLSSLRALHHRPVAFALILLLTGANWFASIVQTALLFGGVGAAVPFGFTTAALPIAIFAGLLPITFAGMGTRDLALVTLFAPFASSSQALAVGLLYSFFGHWLLAVLGLPFVRRALTL